MLGRYEQCQQVTFDEYKWKVSYAMPTHGGKDYWTKKMEDRIAAEKEEAESVRARNKKMRFSLMKRKSAKSVSFKDG